MLSSLNSVVILFLGTVLLIFPEKLQESRLSQSDIKLSQENQSKVTI